jgi:hypothetical protein
MVGICGSGRKGEGVGQHVGTVEDAGESLYFKVREHFQEAFDKVRWEGVAIPSRRWGKGGLMAAEEGQEL